jgi:RNA-binding protein
MSLSTSQTRYLRGLSHHLRPVVTVADKGLSENVLAELDSALDTHELIKVKLRGERETRKTWIEEITRQFHAERVHVIGQVACFYRRNKKKPVIALPDAT